MPGYLPAREGNITEQLQHILTGPESFSSLSGYRIAWEPVPNPEEQTIGASQSSENSAARRGAENCMASLC